ncbi:hypothetical protein BKA63DRAFT_487801 [Paraphoma chrysanthemicola]|nr:hypothetical protein BKA63DRAFT_487801 [Paraphoma chrysanthemicola]
MPWMVSIDEAAGVEELHNESDGSFLQQPAHAIEGTKGLLQLIRALTVGESRAQAGYDSSLSELLNGLRHDQLLEFNGTTETPLHARQFLALQHQQTNLNCLRVRLDWDIGAVPSEEVASWAHESTPLLASSLRRLKTLGVYVGDLHSPGEHTQALHKYELAYNHALLSCFPYQSPRGYWMALE